MQSMEWFESSSDAPARLQLAAGACIRVRAGRLWLTVEGQANDVWLGAGESWSAAQAANVWLSGEPVAQFAVLRPRLRQIASQNHAFAFNAVGQKIQELAYRRHQPAA